MASSVVVLVEGDDPGLFAEIGLVGRGRGPRLSVGRPGRGATVLVLLGRVAFWGLDADLLVVLVPSAANVSGSVGSVGSTAMGAPFLERP